MHDEYTTNRMIKSFMSRKAAQFPELFEEKVTKTTLTTRFNTSVIDVVLR